MFALRPLAIAVKLIDRPGGRKRHNGEVPVVGGLSMLLGIVLGMGLLSLPDWQAGTLLAACTVLVTVGLIDDLFDLNKSSIKSSGRSLAATKGSSASERSSRTRSRAI